MKEEVSKYAHFTFADGMSILFVICVIGIVIGCGIFENKKKFRRSMSNQHNTIR